MSTRTTSTTKISALDFHDRLIAEKGVEAASGFSAHGRRTRFEIIARCLEQFPLGVKLLDYGCNDGLLYDTLRRGFDLTAYTGMDINPQFIAWAKERLKDSTGCDKVTFTVGNIMEDATLKRIKRLAPDVIVASGILCYTENASTYQEVVRRLFQHAKHGVILNVLSTEARTNIVNTKGVFRWSPERVLKALRKSGCTSWEILHSYIHNDMTVLLRKKWTHFVKP